MWGIKVANGCALLSLFVYILSMGVNENKTMSTVQKGDLLENAFYEYLLEQKQSGELVHGLYQPEQCGIFNKKSYYCKDREADVEFDIVIEIRRENADDLALAIVFECKHYQNNVPEKEIRDFSDKLQGIFKHNVKGVIVVSSQLQSGAERIANNRGLGLVKYDQHGFETILQRQTQSWVSSNFIENNMFQSANDHKATKFSGYYNDIFFSSVGALINHLDGRKADPRVPVNPRAVPYIAYKEMDDRASILLKSLSYFNDAVNLTNICDELSINLIHVCEKSINNNGKEVLGEANFERKSITIYPHENEKRERFTISHEIGHFYLEHGKFLRSESVVESDLFLGSKGNNGSFYQRLEFQANTFAACLLLPRDAFFMKLVEVRKSLEITKESHGYVYVDDQPCNYGSYNLLLHTLSDHFQVSKQATEIRLKNLNLLTDNRKSSGNFYWASQNTTKI